MYIGDGCGDLIWDVIAFLILQCCERCAQFCEEIGKSLSLRSVGGVLIINITGGTVRLPARYTTISSLTRRRSHNLR